MTTDKQNQGMITIIAGSRNIDDKHFVYNGDGSGY